MLVVLSALVAGTPGKAIKDWRVGDEWSAPLARTSTEELGEARRSALARVETLDKGTVVDLGNGCAVGYREDGKTYTAHAHNGLVWGVIRGDPESWTALDKLVAGELSPSDLASVPGTFVCAVFDKRHAAGLVARSAPATSLNSLTYGADPDGVLVFSSDPAAFKATSAKKVTTVHEFPAGKFMTAGGGAAPVVRRFGGDGQTPKVSSSSDLAFAPGQLRVKIKAEPRKSGELARTDALEETSDWGEVINSPRQAVGSPTTQDRKSKTALLMRKQAALHAWVMGR